ncbi:ABC transporter ATP-binding protein [Xenorhabdus indica]|uniref:ABC transporter ATP-binding protein n=1 Tax=Xenorhabdus indica TaxID=333964 RepID=UPI001656B5A9|nr:ABC transporter ATP-binding protein [Xenorhabdus indica]MBC8945691.1 ABC transporter [Xenorhabdus indica]
MIHVNNLNYTIGKRQFFTSLNFHLLRGSIGAVLGPNGRGKTTLLRILLGLQKGATGHIALNAPVAYVPQLNASPFTYSVKTMISLGRIRHLPWYASPSADDYRIIDQCIDYLGLIKLADHPFDQLSGGEKQMVMIARALAGEPEILILDEPTSALDLANQDNVLTVLRELAANRSMTILFTSHCPQHALHIADHALLLFTDGSYQFGQTETVLTEPHLQMLYQIPIAVTPINHQNRQTQGVIPLFR